MSDAILQDMDREKEPHGNKDQQGDKDTQPLNEKEKNDDDDNELKEVIDIDLTGWDEKIEPVQLKKPNQRAFEMYKEARKKAKDAKKQSVLAYLEAQKIKRTYLLDDIESSDSEEEDDYNEDN
jgi:hypothetical protein